MVTVMRHERVVHHRHGKPVEALGPGRHRYWSLGHTFVTVDTRVGPFDVRPPAASHDGTVIIERPSTERPTP